MHSLTDEELSALQKRAMARIVEKLEQEFMEVTRWERLSRALDTAEFLQTLRIARGC